jgi:hypothetical protein
MAKTEDRDHVDAFLESIHLVLPDLDLEVEGIVDRISGLARRVVAGLVPAFHAVLEAPNALAQRTPQLGQSRGAEHDQRNQEHDHKLLG